MPDIFNFCVGGGVGHVQVVADILRVIAYHGQVLVRHHLLLAALDVDLRWVSIAMLVQRADIVVDHGAVASGRGCLLVVRTLQIESIIAIGLAFQLAVAHVDVYGILLGSILESHYHLLLAGSAVTV